MMDLKKFHCRKHKASSNNTNLKMIAPQFQEKQIKN